MQQQTLVILKPEALERCIIGSVLQYFDHHGFTLVASRVATEPEEMWAKHYDDVLARIPEDAGKALIKRMARGDCLFLVYKGENCIAKTREFLGATNPEDAARGTIRSCFGTHTYFNVAHASDSITSARKEIDLWFPNLH